MLSASNSPLFVSMAAALIAVSGAGSAIARFSETKAATGSEFFGVVTRVIDGDTVEVNVRSADNKRIKVRLTDIDAPEKRHGSNRPGQPYGQTARRYLSSLALDKQVRLQCYGQSSYDRDDSCRMFVGDVDASRELVRAGLAWVEKNPRYVRDKTMHDAQREAQAASVGMWNSKEQPIAPWHWRIACWKHKECESSE
jgi:micrococcal nuclease